MVRQLDRRFCSTTPQNTGKEAAKLEKEVAHASTTDVATDIPERKPFRGGNSIEALLVEKRRREFLELYPDAPIDRYLPPSDPYAFLIEKEKLTAAESRWQAFFVTLPWLVFASMLATPFLILRYHLDNWQDSGEKSEETEKLLNLVKPPVIEKTPCRGLEELKFTDMPLIIDGREVALVLLYHPDTFRSKFCLPFLRDLGEALRDTGVCVRLIALDLTTVVEQDEGFRARYPPVTGPHLQVIVPTEKEAVVYDEQNIRMRAQTLLGSLTKFVEIPEEMVERAKTLDSLLVEGEEKMVSFAFVEEPKKKKNVNARVEAEKKLDFSQGLEMTLSSIAQASAAL